MAEITIYTKPGCPFCIKLKKLLKEQKITITEIDVISNKEGAKGAVHRQNSIPVPQVDIAGRIFYDYNTEEDLVQEIKELQS